MKRITLYKFLLYITLFTIVLTISACTKGCSKPTIKINKHGIPIKVLTIKDNTQILNHKDEKLKLKVKLFSFYYIYENSPGDYYLIAEQVDQKEPTGLIHKDDVVEWNNREALCLSYLETTDMEKGVSFYKTLDDLIKNKNCSYKESAYIIPNVSKLKRYFNDDTIRLIRTKLNKGAYYNQFKQEVFNIIGINSFNRYWNKILDYSTILYQSYKCNVEYTRDTLPMPALEKGVMYNRDYYKVAYLYRNREGNSFNKGWIKIPKQRDYKIKIYITLTELYSQQLKINKLIQLLTKNPDKKQNSDRQYIKRLLDILTGEAFTDQKDETLFEILISLPEASKPKEVINRSNSEKLRKAKYSLGIIKGLITDLKENGKQETWMNLEDTLN